MSPDLNRLLDESRWLGGLARRLVGDPGLVDDLVQETLVSALQAENQPEPGKTRGWLATILRNKAANYRRSGARRVYNERAGARSEAVPGPDELAELLESEGLLRDALAELPEPYRRTVMLRYREGLSAAEIARHDGEPAGTVRWRLKSGLDQLRVALEKRDSNWAAVLAPLAKLPAPAVSAVAATGGKAVLLGAALLMVTLAGGAAWWLQDSVEPAREGPLELVAGQEAPPEPQPAVIGDAPARAEVLGARAAAKVPETSAGTSPDVALDRGATQVELRVLDSSGNPIAGAVASPINPDQLHLSSEPSGRDGAVTVEREIFNANSSSATYAVGAPGFGTELVSVTFLPGIAGDAGEVELGLGGAVRGFVTDSTGLAEPAVVVFVEQLLESDVEWIRGGPPYEDLKDFYELLEIKSGYALTGVGSGEYSLGSVPALETGHVLAFSQNERRGEFGIGVSDPVRLEPGEHRELGIVELTLASTPGTRGSAAPGLVVRVALPEGVSPLRFELVASVRAAGGFHAESAERTEDPAVFEVRRGRGQHVSLTLRDSSGVYGPVSEPGIELDGATVVLTPELAPKVELKVFESTGEPAEAANFEWRDGATGGRTGIAPVTFEELGNGLYRWTPPADSFGLRIVSETGAADLGRFGRSEYVGPTEVHLVPSVLPGGRIERAGQPVAGATVELRRLLGDDERWVTGEVFTWVDPTEMAGRAESSPEGRFEFPPVPEGDYVIGVTVDGVVEHARAWRAGDPWSADLSRVGRIEGRVGDDSGEVEPGFVTAWNGLGIRRSVAFDRSGGFALVDLPAGRWFVQCTSYPFARRWLGSVDGSQFIAGYTSSQLREGDSIPALESYQVSVGAVTWMTLETELDRGIEVTGSLRVDGERPPGGKAWVEPAFDSGIVSLTAPKAVIWRADGSLGFTVPQPGSYQLELKSERGLAALSYTLKFQVGDGGLLSPIDLELSTGTLILDLGEDLDEVLIGMHGVENDAGLLYGSCWVDNSKGREIELAGILEGEVRVMRLPGSDAHEGPPEDLAVRAVAAGQRLELQLP